MDLEKKSHELKGFIAQFEPKNFLSDITYLIQFIRVDKPIKSLEGLSSPLRQLSYLASLNISSDINKVTKQKYSNEEFEKIKELINEIEQGYLNLFNPQTDTEITPEWKEKRMIAMPAFLNYFNQAQLNYEEQEIERIVEYFSPFEKEIVAHFNIGVEELIEIYNFIDSIPNEFLEEKINYKDGQQTWEEFCDEMKTKGIMPFDWNNHLPEHFRNLFDFMSDKGKTHRFTREQIESKFGKTKSESFLKTFTCSRKKSNFLYYTEPNILHTRPIFETLEGDFQAIEMKQIVHAIYNTLFNFCNKDEKLREKFYKVRGIKLEDKIEQVFQDFFNGKATVYRSFYTQDGNEQDLLFIIDGLALIVEAKASKRDEPRRDPEMAYPLIISNFEETIQKGYDQAYRVKNKFLGKEILKIYNDQQLKKHIIDIKTKNYHSCFSIVVTLERFGQLQTDLNELLEIWDNDQFPWSVCIDDLEVFLLQLKASGKNKNELIKFLRFREKLHTKIISSDELEICGAFIDNRIDKGHLEGNKTLFFTPDSTDIFDETYHKKGLGFKNEKNLEKKRSGKYMPLGGY